MNQSGFKPFSINMGGTLMQAERPLVMGIVNCTPDSFYASSRCQTTRQIEQQVTRMIADGVDILDIGACSTRPGSESVDADSELQRMSRAMEIVRSIDSKIPVSIDTFRATVARTAIEKMGANIINDISGSMLDDEMAATVAQLRAPYIAMHMRGTPATMQTRCDYADTGVTTAVIRELSTLINKLQLMGVADIIVDPGFGFSKTLNQNYELLSNLSIVSETLKKPMLVGISRKSMITQLLDIDTTQALSATTALHLECLRQGAGILRVHDVAEAHQAITLYQALSSTHHIN